MATAIAVAPEAPCQHLNRTDVGDKAGRQVCDNLECKQIFQDGVPVETSVNSSPKSETVDAPKSTKAAARRARKARKAGIGGKAEGAETIITNKEEDSRAIEVARQAYLKDVGKAAEYVVGMLKGYYLVYKEAEAAVEKRETLKQQLQDDKVYAKKMQFLLDCFSVKPHNEIVVVNGHGYKSVKRMFLDETGYTYEYLHKLGKGLGLDKLLTSKEEADAKAAALKAKREEKAKAAQQPLAPPTATDAFTHAVDENGDLTYCGIPYLIPNTGAADGSLRSNPNLKTDRFPSCLTCLHGVHASTYPDVTPITPAPAPKPTGTITHATEVDLHSLATRIQSAFNHVIACASNLSPAQKDEFYSVLISRLEDERQPAIDTTYTITVAPATESATA